MLLEELEDDERDDDEDDEIDRELNPEREVPVPEAGRFRYTASMAFGLGRGRPSANAEPKYGGP